MYNTDVHNISDNIESIGDFAFYKCNNLTIVTIPNSVLSLGNYVFYWCTGLTSVTIGDNVESIGDYAFSNCTKLTDITIPDGITSINKYTFHKCTGLTAVTIPDSVTSIGRYAFDGCAGLTDITIPDSVKSIEYSVFDGCIGLTSIIIPNGVESIGDFAFYGCTGLTSIIIPDTVESIGDYVFCECTGVTSVIFGGMPSSFGIESFSLGTAKKNVTCTVHSISEDEFLTSYGGDYTTFSYVVHETFRLTIDPDEGYYESVPDGWTKDGNTYYRDFTQYSTITMPEDNLLKEGHTFDMWDITVPSVMIGKDITICVIWTPLKFMVQFESDGETVKFGELDYGSPIIKPVQDPSKNPTAKYAYVFTGWDGYTEGMTVSEEITFTALFKTVLQMSDTEIQSSVNDGIIEVDINDAGETEIPKGMIETLLNAIIEDSNIQGVSVSVPGGSVSLNRTALEALNGSMTDSVSVAISEVDVTELSNTIRNIIGDRPVFNVNIGNISSFGEGLLTITLEYELRPEENPNGLNIWFINDEGTVEKYRCTYDDGYVTFVTGHLSYYSVMYSVIEDGDEIPIIYVAGIAATAIAIALVAVFIIRRRG